MLAKAYGKDLFYLLTIKLQNLFLQTHIVILTILFLLFLS